MAKPLQEISTSIQGIQLFKLVHRKSEMIFSKIFLFQIFSVLSLISCKDNGMKIFIRSMRCNVSEKFVYENVSCFLKFYTRSVASMNVIGTTKLPLTEVQVIRAKEIFCPNIPHFKGFSLKLSSFTNMGVHTEKSFTPRESTGARSGEKIQSKTL